MSTAMGIAAVTAVLENLLNGIFNHPGTGLGTVSVSAVAPDLVQNTVGTNAPLQVNLFLHQVIPSAAWRNVGLPSLAADGNTRLKNPPLALDLHYLLTAYATADCAAEALLGFAVQFIHENPVLARNDIRNNLANLPSNPSLSTLLNTSGLGDQIEMIKIIPATLGREEMAWLWTALKSDYRPTFPFQVSVVLIQAQNPLISALPVLQRNISAQASLLSSGPTLTEINPPNSQPAACLGDVVTVNGDNLAGTSAVVLSNARLGIQQTIAVPTVTSGSSFQFTVPNPPPPTPPAGPTDLPAGVYLVSIQVTTGTDVINSNGLPLAIAPRIDPSWAPGTLVAGPAVSVTVPCAPYVRPGQDTSLLIGGSAAPANAFTAPTNAPSFTFSSLTAASPPQPPLPVRLRVDGIDSPSIDLTQKPPVFAGPFVQVT